jgi:hypothetical protein
VAECQIKLKAIIKKVRFKKMGKDMLVKLNNVRAKEYWD